MKRRALMDQESSHNVIEADVERMLQDVRKQDRAPTIPVLVKKKVVKTLDSLTTIEYILEVDPKTGQQYTVEHWSSNKKQCPQCGRLTPQLYLCELCGKAVCARHYGSINVVDGVKNVPYWDWNDKDWLGGAKRHSREDAIYKQVKVCFNCCFDRQGRKMEEDSA